MRAPGTPVSWGDPEASSVSVLAASPHEVSVVIIRGNYVLKTLTCPGLQRTSHDGD